jgi:hypothetical protein
MDYFPEAPLGESSKALFNKKLNHFAAITNQTIEDLINNPDKSSQALSQQTQIAQTSSNRHMYYSAVTAYLKHTSKGNQMQDSIKQQWLTIQKNNWEERRQQALNNEPTQNQIIVATTIKWQDVIIMRDQLKAGTLEKLLLSLYTYVPPVRADYFDVEINPQKDKTEDNYIILDQTDETKSYIVLHDFKTAHKYTEIKHQLPKPLFDELHKSLREKPRSHVFVMPSNATKPYDRGGFSKWANKVLTALFKVPMTLTSLRHLFISTIDFNQTRATELEKIGNSMGHSISMQKGYQWLAQDLAEQPLE